MFQAVGQGGLCLKPYGSILGLVGLSFKPPVRKGLSLKLSQLRHPEAVFQAASVRVVKGKAVSQATSLL